MLDLFMAPANRLCDALGLQDEHERGMIRMFVNTLGWTTIGVLAFLLAWWA